MLAIVKQHLVQIGQIDGPTEYLSSTLAAIVFESPPRAGGRHGQGGEAWDAGALLLHAGGTGHLYWSLMYHGRVWFL